MAIVEAVSVDMGSNEVFETIQHRFQYLSMEERRRVWLGATSVGRSNGQAIDLLNVLIAGTIQELERQLFSRNIDEISARYGTRSKNIVGVWWGKDCIGNQLTFLAQSIQAASTVQYLGLVASDYIPTDSPARVKDFVFGPYLAVPELQDRRLLDFLSLVFIQEGLYTATHFPEQVVRVGLPHGLDIPAHTTLVKYAGVLFFDYILHPMKEDSVTSIANVSMPREIVEHAGKGTWLVPAGYPKLDEFIKASNACTVAPKIVYHLSLLGVESSFSLASIMQTIRTLLTHFPHQTILFRPDPTELSHPRIVKAVEEFRDFENFALSTASSYIHDYKDAQMVITHRNCTAHTFALATGRPVVLFPDSNGDPVVDTEVGYEVHGFDQLVTCVESILMEPAGVSERLLANRNKRLNNVGVVTEYILNALPVMLKRSGHPDWKLVVTKEGNHSDDSGRDLYSKIRELESPWGESIAILTSAASKFPEDAKLQLMAAKVLLQGPDPEVHHEYFRNWEDALERVASSLAYVPSGGVLLKFAYQWWIATRGVYIGTRLLHQEDCSVVQSSVRDNLKLLLSFSFLPKVLNVRLAECILTAKKILRLWRVHVAVWK